MADETQQNTCERLRTEVVTLLNAELGFGPGEEMKPTYLTSAEPASQLKWLAEAERRRLVMLEKLVSAGEAAAINTRPLGKLTLAEDSASSKVNVHSGTANNNTDISCTDMRGYCAWFASAKAIIRSPPFRADSEEKVVTAAAQLETTATADLNGIEPQLNAIREQLREAYTYMVCSLCQYGRYTVAESVLATMAIARIPLLSAKKYKGPHHLQAVVSAL